MNSAQELLNLEVGRYETGIDPYLDVLTAQTTLLSDQETLATLHIDVMVSSVELSRRWAADGTARNCPRRPRSRRNSSCDYKLQQ